MYMWFHNAVHSQIINVEWVFNLSTINQILLFKSLGSVRLYVFERNVSAEVKYYDSTNN